MAWTKAKTATVVAVAAIIGTSATTVVVKKLVQPKTAAASYPGDWIWRADSKTLDRVPPIFLLRRSTLPAADAPFGMFGKERYLARGKTARELFATVWSQKDSARKLVFTTDLPDEKYDFIVTSQPQWPDRLQSELNKRFGLVEQTKTLETGEAVVLIGTSAAAIAQWEAARPKPVAGAYPGDWIWNANSETLAAVPPICLLRPSTLPTNYTPFETLGSDRYLARGKTVKELMAGIYSQMNSEAKISFLAKLPDDKFDCIVTHDTNWCTSLLSEINKRFDLVEQWGSQTGEAAVFVKKAD